MVSTSYIYKWKNYNWQLIFELFHKISCMNRIISFKVFFFTIDINKNHLYFNNLSIYSTMVMHIRIFGEKELCVFVHFNFNFNLRWMIFSILETQRDIEEIADGNVWLTKMILAMEHRNNVMWKVSFKP